MPINYKLYSFKQGSSLRGTKQSKIIRSLRKGTLAMTNKHIKVYNS